MAGHCEKILSRSKTTRQIALALFFGLVFIISAIFSQQLFAPVQAKPVALSASAIEAFQAKEKFSGATLTGESAIVKDITTGTVLYEKNADAQLPLASLTKVPLVLAVSEVLSPQTPLFLPHSTTFNSKAPQLVEGERWRVGELMSYTLVASSNDVAQMLSDAADPLLLAKYPQAEGSAAIWRMNSMAREMGLTATYFMNPTGLDASATQSGAYGSARDIATLFSYAYAKAPAIFNSTATSTVTIYSETDRKVVVQNTDEALENLPGIVMGKTGLTDLAGGNLAIVFNVGRRQYVAVVLGSSETGRFSDMQELVSRTRLVAEN